VMPKTYGGKRSMRANRRLPAAGVDIVVLT
jgi:hypothetical protein